MLIRIGNRIPLPFILLICTLSLFCITQTEGARLAGDNEVTPAAPQPAPVNRRVLPGSSAQPQRTTLPASEKNPSPATGETNPNQAVKKTRVDEPRYVTIDFDNVDIALFIKFISELTGKNFVVDSNVRGRVTIISPTKISVDEAYKVFESVLEVNGFTTVESGSIIKIVPAIEARSKDIETRLRNEEIEPEDRIVTHLLHLKYANPDELRKVLAPFVSKNSVIVSYPPTGMLIITDVLSNILRLLKIVDAVDIEGIGEEVSVVLLNLPRLLHNH